MSDRDRLFRPAAVDDYAAKRMEGRLLQISPAWTAWVTWLLLALLLTAVAFVTLVQVEHRVDGPAVVIADADGPLIVATFDPRHREALGPSAALSFETDGQHYPVTWQATHPERLGPTSLRQEVGAAADFLHSPDPTLLVRARPVARDAVKTGAVGRLTLAIGRRTLWRQLWSGDS